MHDRKKYITELVDLQEILRRELLSVYLKFDFNRFDDCLSHSEKVENLFTQIFKHVQNSEDKPFFNHYRYLTNAVFHLLKWAKTMLSASEDAASNLRAAKLNASLIDIDEFVYPKDFVDNLTSVTDRISLLERDIKELKHIFEKLRTMPYPVLYEIENNPYNRTPPEADDNETEQSEIEQTPVVSVEFFVDQEPWANPQILQPGKVYNVNGRVRVSKWPKGFDQLILHPVSAENAASYILELPVIYPFVNDSIEITGSVVFKFPQHNFEDNLSVKLLCYFQRSDGQRILPFVIGYDQLVAKVLDPNSNEFMTGFSSMTSALADIVIKLSKELPMLDKRERDDFLKLVRGILNYLGYCLQHGIYKNEKSIAESVFRDRMIQHLVGIPYLGEDVIKEAELAGGRVEISYHGITAELKSETQISDRKQMMEKYGNQALAYASGNGKQLSILCILDLTEKLRPPAPSRNNVVFRSMDVHGFDSEIEFPAKQVVVFIDGNTIKPSDYSK
jgi:hypothetical protein